MTTTIHARCIRAVLRAHGHDVCEALGR
jgi:hypothetical protein